jgi:hypothetical protein
LMPPAAAIIHSATFDTAQILPQVMMLPWNNALTSTIPSVTTANAAGAFRTLIASCPVLGGALPLIRQV